MNSEIFLILFSYNFECKTLFAFNSNLIFYFLIWLKESNFRFEHHLLYDKKIMNH
jgi:hypothetical protein